MGLFPMDSVPELSTKNLGNSPRFLSVTHMALFTKWFRSYGIFNGRCRFWILFLDRTTAERILTFGSRIGRNSESPEYHFCRQLSQLSDGLSNGSKCLVICELWLLETQPLAWIGNSEQIAPFGTNQVFGKISWWPPQKLWIRKIL
jgi:hypothetical protein